MSISATEKSNKDASIAFDATSVIVEGTQEYIEGSATPSLQQMPPSTPVSSGSIDTAISSSVSRMTRSKHILPESDTVDDFKRARTRFTTEQIRELEHLFYTYGPHPTRDQRVAVAQRIQVPPRTVQIFLQNRRQRDTKNKTALSDAQLAKELAIESNEASNDAFGTELSEGLEGELCLSQDGDSVIDESTTRNKHIDEGSKNKQASKSSTQKPILAPTNTTNLPSIPATSKNPKVATRSKPRPLVTRTVSLDQVAEKIETGRRAVAENSTTRDVAKNQTGTKEARLRVSAGSRSVLSSSPMKDKLVLDELKTPMKPAIPDCQFVGLGTASSHNQTFKLHQQGSTSINQTQETEASVFKKPAAPAPRESYALWTRMISSSPTALSPITNRQHGLGNTIRVINDLSSFEPRGDNDGLVDTGVLVGSKEGRPGSNLELARALAQACDRRSGRKSPKLTGEETSSQSRSRGATLSVLKRFREENGENEAPRKRASLDGLRKNLHRQAVLDQHKSLNNPKQSRDHEKTTTTTADCTDASVTGDDDSFAPSSPTSISSGLAETVCRGSGLPLSGGKKPIKEKVEQKRERSILQIRGQNAVTDHKPDMASKNVDQPSITDLSALEANAALVLASFFSKI
ncbi:hypothetical protein FRC14_002714 [Serendipita sp. 396]|nr:hypothetical protein FRC14_002714 [Serendipita sp. 396]KAG8789741.1 hypothetical protein FRC15_003810 [Serendipita sp. 397]KAG8804280.1 hypothetical protein FRC16_010609 [Serendipita sp. 398]KAG8823271.1 hypothetical protein FRC19_004293 [Serendipita sp. 401]KAG8838350.1 hypothetical protein FRC18_004955 [Serendipita sp. 400]KAG8877488.1 hypothetical protein FRC20_011157 [Serendipita sp. 405]KAG9055045.1 hypothetical protein FS842_003304 [Serendipita sp. 407]